MHRLFGLTTALAGLLLAGCMGTNLPTGSNDPSGNVAGAVAQFIPAGVTLNIEELPEDADVEQSGQSTRGIYQRVTRSAATVVHRFQRLADRGLALLARISSDMTDEDQVQVEGTFDQLQLDYIADFSPFDFDGDGDADGSGNAYQTPVALRVWVDDGNGYARFCAALITTLPTDDNIGAGEFYLMPGVAHPNAPEALQLFVQYDRTQTDHKWNIAYLEGRVHPRYGVSVGVARVDLRTNDGGETEKTVRGSYEFDENPYGYGNFQGAMHYVVGEPGMLISASSVFGTVGVSVSELCIDLAEQEGERPDGCGDFDTQDMTLLDFPQEGVTNWPADFPETPPAE